MQAGKLGPLAGPQAVIVRGCERREGLLRSGQIAVGQGPLHIHERLINGRIHVMTTPPCLLQVWLVGVEGVEPIQEEAHICLGEFR